MLFDPAEIPDDLLGYFEPVAPPGAMTNAFLLGPEPSAWDYCNACGRLFVGADRKAIKTRDGQRVCPCGASDWVNHYACFPSEIPRRAIKAGTSARGACATCGAGWVRSTANQAKPWSGLGTAIREAREKSGLSPLEVAERAGIPSPASIRDWEEGGHVPSRRHWQRLAAVIPLNENRDEYIDRAEYVATGKQDGPKRLAANGDAMVFRPYAERKIRQPDLVLGWRPSCACDPSEPVPCVTLDIFSGSATTGRVARQLGRRYIGLELSDRYANASEALLAREDRPLLDSAPLPAEQQASLFAL